MTKKKKKNLKALKKFLPYFITGTVTLAIVFVGSLDKTSGGLNLSLDAFAKEDYRISVDELSGLYVVADISDALSLASAPDVASNYVIATSMYETGQTGTGKLEKPPITNISTSRGVVEHVVQEGENMDTIARKYGISTDQIRWSNGKKNTDVAVGEVLYVPSAPGIVYTVKSGDTIDSIVQKYGSSAAEIIALNDLEVSGISEGMRIVVKGGALPEKERPEYVPPAPVIRTYTYLGNTSERIGIEVIGYNYYGGGQCVGYATWYRNVSGRSPLRAIPTNWGNANAWARNAAAAGFLVNRSPEVGAIFQTSSGWYGHVGVVTGVNADGSITVEEANYNYRAGRITRSIIPASAVGNFNYIH